MTTRRSDKGTEEDRKTTLPLYPISTGATGRSTNLGRRLMQGTLILCGIIWVSDIAYRIVNDVSYVNRQQCVLYKILPKTGFVVFEYFFETLVVVCIGIFIAVLLGRWFLRLQKFFPSNPVTAFLYASVLPVCSCAVIPLISSLKGRARFMTTMSFVLAAPLLSPYILVLSFSVLGFTYGMLRIASSFLVVMATIGILGLVQRNATGLEFLTAGTGCQEPCRGKEDDIYLETYGILKGMLPLILLGAALGVGLELLGPRSYLLNSLAGKGAFGVLAWITIGVPLYFCNGAEVLFLRPLVSHGFPLGTAIGFSLTSTTVCTTSIAMLIKTIGARLSVVLVVCVFTFSCLLAFLINALF
ncbi:MAG: permease [Desulfobacterota bacterium]|jgi:hypothetical protein|nr:permease [Thermodesulfobacteriota bacterium]